MRKPTPEEIQHAQGKTVPDVIAQGLCILFVGINPGLYTAAVGHHFARPGNRFWPTLYAAGITPRVLAPEEEQELLTYGCGITNIVDRATATAAELSPAELREGARQLAEKIRPYAPRVLAVLGISAYRAAFEQPKAILGLQDERIGMTEIWVLPNPSGLNAHYQRDDLANHYRAMREYAMS
ncbi:MAG TPA: G/U mismatch-specific DNA glycosylase [Armatimonadota bacterium]|jgi:TDG/mug DNA glycosylase family protein